MRVTFPSELWEENGMEERMLWDCQVTRCSLDVNRLSTYEFRGRMDLIGAKGLFLDHEYLSILRILIN